MISGSSGTVPRTVTFTGAPSRLVHDTKSDQSLVYELVYEMKVFDSDRRSSGQHWSERTQKPKYASILRQPAQQGEEYKWENRNRKTNEGSAGPYQIVVTKDRQQV